METLGQLLKREREFRGMSREDLTRLTRISQSTIKILEEDLPVPPHQSVYIRSYLKNYARQIGLDPSEVIARFQSERGEEQAPAIPIATMEGRYDPSRIVLIVLAVMALLGIAYYWHKH